MADKIVQGDASGWVHTEFSYNNIILVDPNKVEDGLGNISERLVDHENLVMYANLEAELLPRTKLNVGSSPDSIRNISIAKMNFLKPDNNDYFNTQYYDELTGKNSINGNAANQIQAQFIPPSNGEKGYTKLTAFSNGQEGSIDNGLLGMTSINMKISGSFIPSVTIELEDVQGRALFQLGENSPYAAFFHLPYPPFYLTIKGYYGQAIKYQLNLEKFDCRFNSFGGNYQVTLKFQGYKFNILNEISMGSLLAVPHMYSTRFDMSNSNSQQPASQTLQTQTSQQSSNIGVATNSQNTIVNQMVAERGYQKIIEVYGEYKAKKLIPPDFPELTVQQLMNKLKMFEQTVINDYPKQSVEPLTNIRDYIAKLQILYDLVIGDNDSWFNKYLNPKPFIGKNGTRYYAYLDSILPDGPDGKIAANTKLENLLKTYNDYFDSNPTLGKNGTNKITNGISMSNMTGITTSADIDWVKTTTEQTGINQPTFNDTIVLINSYTNLFSSASVGSLVKGLTGGVGGSTPYITENDKLNSLEFLKPYFYIFDGTDRFISIIKTMRAEAQRILNLIEGKITEELRKKIEDSKLGLGFSPTVRNILAVIMASAEAFIRLLDDTHTKAWEVKYDPVRKNAILNNHQSSAQGVDTKNVVGNITANASNNTLLQTPVFPWPQFFQEDMTDGKKGKYQLKYIGDPSVVDLTQGYLYAKWPEVEFVEEFMKGLTQRFTPPSTQTPQNIQQFTDFLNINAIEFPQIDVTYADKQIVPFMYEIWERQFMTSRYDNLSRFPSTSIEFQNLKDLMVETDSKNILTSLGVSNPFLNFDLKNFNFTSSNYVNYFYGIEPKGATSSYIKFIKDEFVTPYIKRFTDNSFSILSVTDVGKEPTTKLDATKLESIVTSTQTNQPIIIDTYPFTNTTWDTNNLIDISSTQGSAVYNTTKTLKIYKQRNLISNFTDLFSTKENRPVTNFSYLNVQNPLLNAQQYASTNQVDFPLDYYYTVTPTKFIPTEGYCYFDTPTNKNTATFTRLSGKLPIRTTTSILNTPFFINAILQGVSKQRAKNVIPYTEAAYLLLNSLPLISLREKYKTQGKNLNDLDYMFAALKKFGALHKIPYAWILKIGSIWYRYKLDKINGVDLLSNVWTNVNYKNAYDPVTNDPTKIYNLTFNGTPNKIQLEYSDSYGTSVQSGFYPKLINDFNYFYNGSDVYSTYTDAEIQATIDNGLKIYNFTQSNLNLTQNGLPLRYTTWSVLLPSPNGTYFMVPSFGCTQNQVVDSLTNFNIVVPGTTVNGNNSVYNGSMRLLWASSNYGYFDSSQIKKPATNEYLNSINTKESSDKLSPFRLSNDNNYTSIEEIFSVFGSEILDSFEVEFKNFCKPSSTVTKPTTISDDEFKFTNFQLLLKSLLQINAPLQGETTDNYFSNSFNSQLNSFSATILKFLEYDVIFKYGNPSGYNRYIFDSFIIHNNPVINYNGTSVGPTLINNSSSSTIYLQTPKIFKPYLKGSLPSSNGTTTLNQSKAAYPNEWRELELLVGFSTIPQLVYDNNGSYITDFFIDNNIEFSVDNIKDLSVLIKMYATQKLGSTSMNSTTFTTNLNSYLNNCTTLQNVALDGILSAIRAGLPNYQQVPEKTINSRIDGQQSKVELYESFKSLNDKWIAGGDYKTKTLFEDILFLDKASRNIGDTIYLDIFSLQNTLNEDSYNVKMSVYTFMAGLLINNNFVVMNLPAYVNFYNVQNPDGTGTYTPEDNKIFANNMWGTFLEVDTRESGPKMVCFFVGRPSSYLDLDESKNFLYRSDGIQIEKQGSENSMNEDPNGKKDYYLSNRCVGFNVDIGIRNQNVFSSFNISQSNGKATTESVSTLYNMINQTSGRQSSTQNVSLYNYYSTRSYGCQVTCLGNAMLQPTMYFNLRHVPMFNGPYLITDVSHVITPGSFITTFEGTRQGIYDLPAIENYLQSINQNLLTALEQAVTQREDQPPSTSTTDSVKASGSIQTSENVADSENSCTKKVLPEFITAGFVSKTASATTINKLDFVEKIKKYTSNTNIQAAIYSLCYLRTYKENNFVGYNNNYALITLSKTNPQGQSYFSNYKGYFQNYYSCVSSKTASSTSSYPIASFKDVDTFIRYLVTRLSPNKINEIIGQIGLQEFYICQWQNETINKTTFLNDRSFYQETYNRLDIALFSAKVNGIIPSVSDTKFLNGKNSVPPVLITPTPTPTQVVLPPNANVFTVRRLGTSTNGDTLVTVEITPNTGLWAIVSVAYNIDATSPGGARTKNSGTPNTPTDWNITPYQDVLNIYPPNTSPLSGPYQMIYTVIAKPILSNGADDATRQVKQLAIRCNVTI